MAAQTLPAVQHSYAHYPRPFPQQELTPPYHTPRKLHLEQPPSPVPSGLPDADRPWSSRPGLRGSEHQLPMSRPPTAPHPASSSDHGPRRYSEMASPMPPQRQGAQAQASPRSAQFSLPPLRQLSSTPPTPMTDRRPGNPLGVQSILNPQAELAEQQRNRRRSGSLMQTPSPVESQPPTSLPSISRPTSVDSTQYEPAAARTLQPPGRPSARHMPSPRSPALHRTQSLTVLNAPTGSIDAHQSPFLPLAGRPLGSDPVTSQSALPTPPNGSRAAYFPGVPPAAPTPPPGVVRNDLRRPSMSFPQSGSASPIISPYSRAASVASSQYEAPHQHGGYMAATHGSQMQEPPPGHLTMETERSRVSMTPSGQSSIQIMTIKSQQGHHVQIPVDVQAASKVADEKRKRNAGASARFRARRKEKEREASMSISRLEAQLREAFEDAEFYRGERDFFKSIVFQQQPGAERVYVRPPSPRLRRVSVAPSNAPSSTTGAGSADSPFSGYDDDMRESDRNVRRRTSSYHPSAESVPMQVSGPPANFPPQGFAAANGDRSLPQSFEPHEHRPSSEIQQAPPHSRPILRDPFPSSDAGHYDNRNWAPGPGPGRDSRG